MHVVAILIGRITRQHGVFLRDYITARTRLINSQGQTKYILRLTLITAAIGFPLGYRLIMTFGVMGLIATSLIASLPTLILGLRFIGKNYGVSVDWASSARILLSSAVAAVVTYFVVSELAFDSWIRLTIGATLFVAVLVPVIVLTKAVTRTDIGNLRDMTGGLGMVGKLLNVFLGLLEKLVVLMRV
jgi:hypothetical protein